MMMILWMIKILKNYPLNNFNNNPHPVAEEDNNNNNNNNNKVVETEGILNIIKLFNKRIYYNIYICINKFRSRRNV
jgi:hypothetical protein